MRKDETVKCVVIASTEHPGHAENTIERNWKEKGQ